MTSRAAIGFMAAFVFALFGLVSCAQDLTYRFFPGTWIDYCYAAHHTPRGCR